MSTIAIPEPVRLDDYDAEPVVYCANCLSLKIKHEDGLGIDFCSDCGGTEVIEAPFEEWERKYENKYKHKFTVKSNDIRKSPIFQLPLNKLMHKVSDCPKWKTIIETIYGQFPKGLSKADCIVAFFDRLVKDNKMDALRTLLYKMKI